MTRIDAFLRTRKLTGPEVAQINFIIKKRARRFITAGRKEWLYPEKTIHSRGADIRKTLMPPERDMLHFGGEMFVKYKSGDVHYQDEFGGREAAGNANREGDRQASPPGKARADAVDRPMRSAAAVKLFASAT